MLTITVLYGSLSLMLTWALGLNISLRRLKEKEFSDGGSTFLKRSIRAHRNNVEWVAVGTLALMFAELQGIPARTLHIVGGLFLCARLLHAGGSFIAGKTRMFGAIFTYVLVGGLLVLTLVKRL